MIGRLSGSIMRAMIAALAALTLTAGCEVPPAGAPATRRTGTDAPAARADAGVVLFLGTSLTAGYGVGEATAFPALIQAKLDSVGLPYRVVNTGISGETSAGALRRLDWSLQEPVAVLVLELGANDGLRGLPVDALRANLETILRRTRERYPDAAIVIAGMEAPPNRGDAYTSRFRRVYRDLAREHDAALVPFLLEGVAGDPSLNQEDGIHPTAAGHEVMAENVWLVLEDVLLERTPPR